MNNIILDSLVNGRPHHRIAAILALAMWAFLMAAILSIILTIINGASPANTSVFLFLALLCMAGGMAVLRMGDG